MRGALGRPQLATAGLAHLAEYGVGEETWLTVFDDRTERRPDADVFFRVAGGAEVRPTPIVHINDVFVPIPVELLLPPGPRAVPAQAAQRRGLIRPAKRPAHGAAARTPHVRARAAFPS